MSIGSLILVLAWSPVLWKTAGSDTTTALIHSFTGHAWVELQNKPSCDRKEKLAWQRESAWSPRWEKCFSKWNALIGWFKSLCPWCSTSRIGRFGPFQAPFAPVNSCNRVSSWGLKPSESEKGLRLTALKTHECLLRNFGDTSGPLIRLPKAKIASSSLGDLDEKIWATANGQLATVFSM